MTKIKGHLKSRIRGITAKAKLSRDLKLAKYEQGLHNRLGRGALPSRVRPTVTLPPVWRQ